MYHFDYPWHHHHNHDHCSMGGNHCKHTCPDCGETYCCKCGKSLGGRYFTPWRDAWYYASNALNLNTNSVKTSCSHSH